MPFVSAESLSLVDIAMLAIIIIGLPLEAMLTLKKSRAELASNAPGVRVKHYTRTIMLLWGLSLPILVLWASSGRDWAMLGFKIEPGMLAGTGWGLAALIAGFFAVQFFLVGRSESAREQLRDGMAENTLMRNFMPHTEAEKRVFDIMGISAGIAEEIVFRGYLIWAFSLFLPIWVAAMAALLVFTLLHLYQGAKQLPAVFALGALVTLVYLLSGSLWPAIAVHIFVDVINNSMVWKARVAAV